MIGEQYNINPAVILIFPNPTTGIVYLSSKVTLSGKPSIKVIDTNGKTLFYRSFEKILENEYQKIDLSQLEKGIYFLKAENTNDPSIHKIVIY